MAYNLDAVASALQVDRKFLENSRDFHSALVDAQILSRVYQRMLDIVFPKDKQAIPQDIIDKHALTARETEQENKGKEEKKETGGGNQQT